MKSMIVYQAIVHGMTKSYSGGEGITYKAVGREIQGHSSSLKTAKAQPKELAKYGTL
jgi:hypothetical protein